MKNIFKKWEGGAKKHGGIFNAMAKQADDWGRQVDESLGKPSGVNSEIPDKRKAAENSLKDAAHELTGGVAYPGRSESLEEPEPSGMIEEVVEEKESVLEVVKTIDVSSKSLSMALMKYLLSSAIDKIVSASILELLDRESASNLDVAQDVLAYGNKEVNDQVKAWVLQHIDGSASVDGLREIAIEYYTDHTGETDVTLAIGTGGDTVLGLGAALFATGHPELSVEVASYLLGDAEM